ncbi:MAG TPA: hypothetical protein VFZ53_33425 [Polyangiaceae bacterium]
MRTPSLLALFTALSLATLTGCGGSQPAAEEPKNEASTDESKAEDKAEEKSDAAADSEKKDDKKEEPKPAGGMPEVKRTPKDHLTAPDVVFMFSFNDSDPKKKAEERCEAQSKGDPKKNAQCMTKERNKFPADGMQFKKNDKGDWSWMTLRRTGSKITYLHKIPFEFGDEKETSITLKLSGKDTGTKPMRSIPSTITIEVPNEFQIAMQDPEHGRLVYEAKIGITSEPEGKASGGASR